MRDENGRKYSEEIYEGNNQSSVYGVDFLTCPGSNFWVATNTRPLSFSGGGGGGG
jgi:hypothetical protein